MNRKAPPDGQVGSEGHSPTLGPVPPGDELRARLENLRQQLERKRLSGALITDPANVRYLSGFTGEDSQLLVTPRDKLLLTDSRYLEEAQRTAPGWRRVARPPAGTERIARYAKRLRLKRVAVEPEHLTVGAARGLRKGARGVRWLPVKGMVGELRVRKSAWELARIEAALRIQEACFRQICRLLRPGLREREAAAELRYRLVQQGADDQAFECMFQWGSNSSLPHGRPTDRRFREEQIVLIDWGAKYQGYHADLTRTFFIGSIPSRLRRIHEVVRQAQAEAIAAIAPGVAFADVDRVARGVIRRAGFGKYFGHSTGHGIGLRIHESPTLSKRGEGTLKPGMVVTVEPGIYLPGLGGVRIEDDILVTADGHRTLSRVPVGLRWDGSDR